MNDPIARVTRWAQQTPGIAAAVLVGSNAREPAACSRADGFSDWDFVIFTSRPEQYDRSAWLEALGYGEPRIYAVRDGTVGSARRVTAIFPGKEMDFVMVPALPWRLRRWAFALGLHRTWRRLARDLADLAVVARPGYRFLHGSQAWRRLYARAVAEIPDPRLGDEAIVRRAQVFAADCVWLQRKIARGELVAARRQLFRSLVETNLQLLHELKLRRGEPTFPEGRRFERIATEGERAAFDVGPVDLTAASLSTAVRHAADAFRSLMSDLLGDRWRDILPVEERPGAAGEPQPAALAGRATRAGRVVGRRRLKVGP